MVEATKTERSWKPAFFVARFEEPIFKILRLFLLYSCPMADARGQVWRRGRVHPSLQDPVMSQHFVISCCINCSGISSNPWDCVSTPGLSKKQTHASSFPGKALDYFGGMESQILKLKESFQKRCNLGFLHLLTDKAEMPPFLRRNSEDPANQDRGQVREVGVFHFQNSVAQTWLAQITWGL